MTELQDSLRTIESSTHLQKKLNIYRFIIDIFQNKQNISVSASERRSSGKEALFALLTPLPRISETTPLKKH